MNSQESVTLAHVYGLAGLIPGILGLVIAYKATAPWSEYAVLASGWITAAFYAFMIFRLVSRAESAAEQVGHLTERVEDLKKQLESRQATLDYIASFQIGRKAIPRVIPSEEPDGE